MSKLKNAYETIMEHVKSLKQYNRQLIFFMISGCILYFPLMNHRLVNQYDGLWEYSYHRAREWELSLGRWFWLYLDKMRFGVSEDPLTSLITLLCYSVGLILILDIFNLGQKKATYLAGALFLSNTAVCISLSYRYMSPTFGIAFLWNVLSAWVLTKFEKSRYLATLISAICIAFGMGTYQSNIGCACLIFLTFLMYMIARSQYTMGQIVIQVGKLAASLLLGAWLYLLLLKAHLAAFGVSLSDYNGASGYSVWNTLKKIPIGLRNAYFLFGFYFKNDYFKTNLLSWKFVYLIPFLCIGILLILKGIQLYKISPLRTLLFLLCTTLLPTSCGTVLFIATDTSTSLQMTAPWALALPVLLCLLASWEDLPKLRISKWLLRVNFALLTLTLYGCIYQLQIDQAAMLEGQTATQAIASEILDDLKEAKLLSDANSYCFVGLPAANPLFATTDMYRMANTYAQFGSWWTDPSCTRRSYESMFRHLKGVNLHVCSPDVYSALLGNESVRSIPAFPEDGYITVVDDIVVVKVSE